MKRDNSSPNVAVSESLVLIVIALLMTASPGACSTSPQAGAGAGGSTPGSTVTVPLMRAHTLRAHTNTIDAIAYSPHGALFATGSWSRDPKWGPRGEVKVWDAQGKLRRTLHGHTAAVKTLAFSPNGQILASGAYDKTLILFNTRSGAATKLPGRHAAPVILLSFSPDGRQLLSGDEGGTVVFWDVRTLRPVQERFLRGHSGRMRAYAYSWANDVLAAADASQSVMLWRAEQDIPRVLTKNRGMALSLAFSPDGRLLASANYSDVWLWDVATGNDVSALVHDAPVNVLAFSPDGSILACGLQNGEVVLHETNDPLGSPTSLTHGSRVSVLAFSPSPRVMVSGSSDGSLIVWR